MGSRAGDLKQMLLDLLEDPQEIRRICIMGRKCTIKKENNNVECSLAVDKQIAEGQLLLLHIPWLGFELPNVCKSIIQLCSHPAC